MPRGYLLSTTLNRPRRADVRTRTAVGAKVRIDPGPFFSGRNSLEGTDLQAFSAVGAALSNPVSHIFNAQFGMRSAEFLTGITGLDFYSAFLIRHSEFKSSSTYPHPYRFFLSRRQCPWHPFPHSGDHSDRLGTLGKFHAG
jgi:hypothetical protein